MKKAIGLLTFAICLLGFVLPLFAQETSSTEASISADSGDVNPAFDFEEPYNTSLALSLSLYPAIAGTAIGSILITVGLRLESSGWVLPGLGVLLAGTVIGPSLGHYYLGNPLRATLTMTARAILAAVPFIYLGVKFHQLEGKEYEDASLADTMGLVLLDTLEISLGFVFWAAVSGVGIATLGIIDTVSAFRSAGRKNAEVRSKQEMSWIFVPTVLRTHQGSAAPGGVFTLLF